jgi:hypothetical protein
MISPKPPTGPAAGIAAERGWYRTALTPLQAAWVIIAALACGCVLYSSYLGITSLMLEREIRTMTPAVITKAEKERDELVKAIEAYREHFGAYPPDHQLSATPLRVDPITNQLFYELAGTIHDPANETYKALRAPEPLEKDFIRATFGRDGFRNSGETTNQFRSFIRSEDFALTELHDNPDVLGIRFIPYIENLSEAASVEFDASPWRYISTKPIHHPGRFDLWMILTIHGHEIRVGN